MFCQKNPLQFQVCLVVSFLTGHHITKQSRLFLFNVGLRVQLGSAGQQLTGAEIEWKIRIKRYAEYMLIKYKKTT